MSDAVTWDVDKFKLELKETLERISEGAIKGVVNGGLLLEAEVKRISPIDQGAYRTSIRCDEPVITENNVEVRLGSPMIYACQLEYGGVINAKPGGFLHFIGRDGEDVFVKTVHQPGKPHWRPTFDLNKGRVHDIIAEEIRKEKEG